MNNSITITNNCEICDKLSCNDSLGLDINKYLCLDCLENYNEWKILPDYENRYEVSTQGHIRKSEDKKLIREVDDEALEYKKVSIKHKKNDKKFVLRRVHRLIAETFLLPIKDKETVNHKNRNKLDNRLFNLEWASNSEQIKHYHETNTINNKNKPVHMYDSDYTEIKKTYPSIKQAAEATELSSRYISNVCLRKQETHGGYGWRHVEEKDHSELEGEIWLQFRDTNYEGSNFGRVRNRSTKKLLELQPDGDGRTYLQLCGTNYQISRIIAEIFIDNPYGKEDVIHKDGTVKNNNCNNLQWATRKETNIYFSGKPIIQIDFNGNIVKKYPSISTATEKNPKFSHGEITNTCKRIRKHYKEHFWCYEKDYDPLYVESLVKDVIDEKNRPKVAKKVGVSVKIEQLDGTTRKSIRFWNSISEAEKAIKITGIGAAIKTGNRCANFYWRRV